MNGSTNALTCSQDETFGTIKPTDLVFFDTGTHVCYKIFICYFFPIQKFSKKIFPWKKLSPINTSTYNSIAKNKLPNEPLTAIIAKNTFVLNERGCVPVFGTCVSVGKGTKILK